MARPEHPDHEEVVPAARGCAVLVSAAACGMVILALLVLVVVQLFVAPAVADSLTQRQADVPGLTAFVLSVPWWVTLPAALVIGLFVVLKELAISHALANFIINVLLLLLVAGCAVTAIVALTLPYVVNGNGATP